MRMDLGYAHIRIVRADAGDDLRQPSFSETAGSV